MSYLSEAHNQWHTVYGWNQVCPLDCGITEYDEDEFTAPVPYQPFIPKPVPEPPF